MFQWIGRFVFTKLYGWTFKGAYPGNDKSFVVIVAPHTSMWDVPLGISLKWWQQMNVTFYVKEELFFFPLNIILKAIQAVPIRRSGNTNFVSAVAEDFKQHGNRRILITPLPTIFDFEKKEIVMNEFFYPTEDEEKDMRAIEDIFRGYQGKVREYSFG